MIETEYGSRERILRAATDLLETGGREAVSTRAVSAAAGVQSPTIYRQFGDMRGLLEAVASHGFAQYLADKRGRPREDDPVDDLRHGWDLHVGFGLEHPALYSLMYGDPRPDGAPAAARDAADLLSGLVHRVAAAGRLRVSTSRAATMIHAAGVGVTLTMIGLPAPDRDMAVSGATREAILRAVTTDRNGGDAAAADQEAGHRLTRHAVALRALLSMAPETLTVGERIVMAEWLDRLVAADN